MLEVQDNVGTISGGIVAALFVLAAIISKFRVWWTRDTTEAAISAATTAVIASLREENARLHTQVLQLQQEVSKLQLIISELTIRQAEMQIREEEARKTTELAMRGAIERRNRRNAGVS